jgi:aconitate hydratase
MGVLPLQFKAGESAKSLGLIGTEVVSTVDLNDGLRPGGTVTVQAVARDGSAIIFETTCRIDTPVEVDYYRNGGILHTVLRQFLHGLLVEG